MPVIYPSTPDWNFTPSSTPGITQKDFPALWIAHRLQGTPEGLLLHSELTPSVSVVSVARIIKVRVLIVTALGISGVQL